MSPRHGPRGERAAPDRGEHRRPLTPHLAPAAPGPERGRGRQAPSGARRSAGGLAAGGGQMATLVYRVPAVLHAEPALCGTAGPGAAAGRERWRERERSLPIAKRQHGVCRRICRRARGFPLPPAPGLGRVGPAGHTAGAPRSRSGGAFRARCRANTLGCRASASPLPPAAASLTPGSAGGRAELIPQLLQRHWPPSGLHVFPEERARAGNGGPGVRSSDRTSRAFLQRRPPQAHTEGERPPPEQGLCSPSAPEGSEARPAGQRRGKPSGVSRAEGAGRGRQEQPSIAAVARGPGAAPRGAQPRPPEGGDVGGGSGERRGGPFSELLVAWPLFRAGGLILPAATTRPRPRRIGFGGRPQEGSWRRIFCLGDFGFVPRSGWRLSREETLGKAPGSPGQPPRAAVPRAPAASARPACLQARPPPGSPLPPQAPRGWDWDLPSGAPSPAPRRPRVVTVTVSPRGGLGGRVSLAIPATGAGHSSGSQGAPFQLLPSPAPGGRERALRSPWHLWAAFPGDTGQCHITRGCERLGVRRACTLLFSIVTFLPRAPAGDEPVCVCARRGYRQLESLFPGRLPRESLPGGAGVGGRCPGRQRPEFPVPPEPCCADKCGPDRSRGPTAAGSPCVLLEPGPPRDGRCGLFRGGGGTMSDAVRQRETRGSGIQERLRPRHRRALPAEGPAGTQGVNDGSALSFKGLTRDRSWPAAFRLVTSTLERFPSHGPLPSPCSPPPPAFGGRFNA
ncbi:collagen alpha-1(I) chain-like [Molothrus aeneus]|uniref:collagen alpha-1(I) chain-like n=1 Tax=Molothrus aeneus TaxID=84833 RepID=UPI0034598FEF